MKQDHARVEPDAVADIVQCGLSVRKTMTWRVAETSDAQIVDFMDFGAWLLRLDSNQQPSG